ncbi:MAG: FAD-dependent oxidoreductase [Candidatus Portnoybacteria bacterium]|nr:FAD-dependent oxidoreductase [Candidatus Portnoybacteria bacterium]
MRDLIIIGGGPAAMSAGIYAARKKLKTLLICKELGGQMNEAGQVENYLGFESILGMELAQKFVSHLRKFDLEIKEEQEIQEIKKLADSGFEILNVHHNKEQARALIITSGKGQKKLGVPGEEKFIGKGISFCAVCDAPLFKNKEVAVVGGGNAAVQSALEMAQYASKVYLLSLYPKLVADKIYQGKIEAASNIEILFNVQVKEIQGDKFVTGLIYQDKISQEKKKLSVEGIHIEIGSVPSSNFIKGVVKLNKQGEIKIDSFNRTSQPGILAAGDVTDVSHKQIVIAAGEGAKAALNAYGYLSKLER